MIKKNFLVEIGTEELPYQKLEKISYLFKLNLVNEIKKTKIIYEEIISYYTPRRLAVKIKNLKFSLKQKDNCLKIKYFKKIILSIIVKSLNNIFVTKYMRWGDNKKNYFIRPINNLTMMLDKDLISGKILDIKSNRRIFGHRFYAQKSFFLDEVNNYEKKLFLQGKVIADANVRKNKIKKEIEQISKKFNYFINTDNSLLEEVNALVEWPVILIGEFEEKFLQLPQEVLINIMEKQQKYFALFDNKKKLITKFLFVSNIETKNMNNIIKGNESVLRSRFSDAEYFFLKDKKIKLEELLYPLKKVLFYNKLGNMYEKTNRIKKLSIFLADTLNINSCNVIRSATLSKCDLISHMVCEFPNTQGIIGMHYARYFGENEEVSLALKEQYKPYNFKDAIPFNLTSCILSLSDKIDTLVGIIGIQNGNILNKSKKDPFALRRIALSSMRIIIEKKLMIDLKLLIEKSLFLYKDKIKNKNITLNLINFMFQRLQNWYKNKGFSKDIFQAVISCKNSYPLDLDKRLKALKDFFSLPEGKELYFVNKRLNSILSSYKNKLINFDNVLLQEKEEIKLANYINILKKKHKFFLKTFSYKKALISLSSVSPILEKFFKNIRINVDNYNLKINRISLINQIKIMLLDIAEISLIKIK